MIAHAPILSSVSRSSAHRSFCAIVPFDMIAAAVSPTDTPIAVTMPGEHLHSSMIGSSVNPPPPPPPLAPRFSRPSPPFFSAVDAACRSCRAPSGPCRTSCTACAAGRTAAGRRARAPRGAGGSRCRRTAAPRRGSSAALRTIRTWPASYGEPAAAQTSDDRHAWSAVAGAPTTRHTLAGRVQSSAWHGTTSTSPSVGTATRDPDSRVARNLPECRDSPTAVAAAGRSDLAARVAPRASAWQRDATGTVRSQ